VPSDLAGRVFEPFFTTKPIGEGTGLGLSVSLGIAKAHGGTLTLASAERGASFSLELPLAPLIGGMSTSRSDSNQLMTENGPEIQAQTSLPPVPLKRDGGRVAVTKIG
jgi:hypothetical protein